MSMINQFQEKKNNAYQYPRNTTLFQKKWGMYTWNALDVFDMNRKGEAVLRFSRRPVPVNLFSYIRIQLATAAPVSAVATAANSRYTKIFRPISNDNAMGVNIIKPTNGELKQDGNQNQTSDFHQWCSTPKSQQQPSPPFVEQTPVFIDEESYDYESNSTITWPDDTYQMSEFECDPYESYDWES